MWYFFDILVQELNVIADVLGISTTSDKNGSYARETCLNSGDASAAAIIASKLHPGGSVQFWVQH